MSSALQALTSGAPASALSSTTSKLDLNKQDFLQLLVTQLKNQDPLSPLQPYEFAAQLAQFSSVEQLTNLNDTVSKEGDSLALSTLVDKTNLSASLVGRNVLAEGNQVVVPATGGATVRFEVGTGSGAGTLIVKDSSGREVVNKAVGELTSGRQSLTLPSDLPAGTYTYEVTVAGDKGASVPVVTYTSGAVTGVEFNNGKIQLKLGPLTVDLDSLAAIEATP